MRKPGPPREIPPPLELECLKALWALGEGNVKQVRAVLEPRKPLAYTTVMTLLERLVKKGGAARRKTGRSFLYTPLLSQEAMRRAAVRELAESLFSGDEDQLRGYLNNGSAAEPVAAAEPEERLDAALL